MKNLASPSDFYQYDHIKDSFERFLHKVCFQIKLIILKSIFKFNCLDGLIPDSIDKSVIEAGILIIKKELYNSTCFKTPSLVGRFKAIRNESPFLNNELTFDMMVSIFKEVIKEAVSEQQTKIMTNIFLNKARDSVYAHLSRYLNDGSSSKEVAYLTDILNRFEIKMYGNIKTDEIENAILLCSGPLA